MWHPGVGIPTAKQDGERIRPPRWKTPTPPNTTDSVDGIQFIQTIRCNHSRLCHLLDLSSSLFSEILLVKALTTFATALFTAFIVLAPVLIKSATKFPYICYIPGFIITTVKLLSTCIVCRSVKHNMEMFEKEISRSWRPVTACGLFEVDLPLLSATVVNLSTFFVTLLQFHLSLEP
ncbi:unnamed protein product [Darwinula stevensoni]|uniref:Uncharacterized protein n=1 Tax=Darwinula stevensoni TaxID=69355 RepID=A0A7R9A703_9CRUS|nr:unnamed protein product [Darwinula stevensoni]CAG0890923.1 unnamed protein product [Darwinula stevensoni]